MCKVACWKFCSSRRDKENKSRNRLVEGNNEKTVSFEYKGNNSKNIKQKKSKCLAR